MKELNLTEGKGTGIPTIKRALSLNGSKPAVYDTDGDERRFFVVIIPVHEVFLLEDGNQGSNQDKLKSNQDRILENLQKLLFVTTKKSYTEQMLDRMIDTLNYCLVAKSKIEILNHIGLSNQTKNFKENIEPIIECGLMKRTITDNLTSKNQRYITTKKGNKLITAED